MLFVSQKQKQHTNPHNFCFCFLKWKGYIEKAKKSHKKSFIFCVENQAWISAYLGESPVLSPPLLSLKISVDPLRPRGGLVVLENTVITKVVLISQQSFRNSLWFMCIKWGWGLLDMIIWLHLKLWATLFQHSFHPNYQHEVLRKEQGFWKCAGEFCIFPKISRRIFKNFTFFEEFRFNIWCWRKMSNVEVKSEISTY